MAVAPAIVCRVTAFFMTIECCFIGKCDLACGGIESCRRQEILRSRILFYRRFIPPLQILRGFWAYRHPDPVREKRSKQTAVAG